MEPSFVYRAKCLKVIDGDTYDFAIDVGFRLFAHHRIRALRINTPELNSKDIELRGKAVEAQAFCKAAIEGRDVTIRTEKADAFGRYLAEVWYHDESGAEKNLGDMLLSLGLAELYTG